MDFITSRVNINSICGWKTTLRLIRLPMPCLNVNGLFVIHFLCLIHLGNDPGAPLRWTNAILQRDIFFSITIACHPFWHMDSTTLSLFQNELFFLPFHPKHIIPSSFLTLQLPNPTIYLSAQGLLGKPHALVLKKYISHGALLSASPSPPLKSLVYFMQKLC